MNQTILIEKKRVALLTTWQEVCGIAHYSSFLKRALDRHLDVTVIPTPREIIHNAQTKIEVRAADELIDNIAFRVRDFDVVSVQFEPGLYGRSHRQAITRVKRILANSKDFIISFHYFHREPVIERKSNLRHPIQTARNYLRSALSLLRERPWKSLYSALVAHSKKHKVTVITHTKRDTRYMRSLMPSIEVLDNPLCYMDEDYIANLDGLAKSSNLAERLPPLDEKTRFLGVFGFYSEYKGFDTAVMALNHLPENYELLMFSGVHDSTLAPDQGVNKYLASILELVKKKKLTNRVHFLGSLSDDDMLLGMMSCDAVIIPYINSVHTASGPASQAIELNRMTYCTRNRQFTELAKYFPDNFEFIDIGNSIELAQKIKRSHGRGADRIVNGIRFVEYPARDRRVTIKDTVENYLRGCDISYRSRTPVHRDQILNERS